MKPLKGDEIRSNLPVGACHLHIAYAKDAEEAAAELESLGVAVASHGPGLIAVTLSSDQSRTVAALDWVVHWEEESLLQR
ncbi:MAG: hypothetical protein AAF458_08780 [Pseudomonadota bacterium]